MENRSGVASEKNFFSDIAPASIFHARRERIYWLGWTLVESYAGYREILTRDLEGVISAAD